MRWLRAARPTFGEISDERHIPRDILPSPDIPPAGLTTYDAKDPDTDVAYEAGTPVSAEHTRQRFSGASTGSSSTWARTLTAGYENLVNRRQAAMLGVVTFVVGFAVCIAIFAALDVSAVYLVAPAIAVAAGAFAAYRNALDDRSHPPNT